MNFPVEWPDPAEILSDNTTSPSEQDWGTKNATTENPAILSGLGEGIYCHTIFRLGVIQKIESHISGRCYPFP